MNRSALILGLVLAMTARWSPAAAQPAPVVLNAILSMTGPAGFVGTNEKQALTAIEALVNKTGGIKGRPLKFNIVDDESDPKIALQLATQIVARPGSVVLGPGFTATCLAVLPLFKTGPVDYCLSPSILPTPGGYVYSSSASTHDDALASIRFLRSKGWTRMAIVTPTDASGSAIDQALLDSLALPENKNMTVVAHERFASNDLSIAAQAERVKAANPQAIIGWASGTSTGTLFRGLHDVGNDAPVLAGNGNMVVEQLAQYVSFIPRELYFDGRRGLVDDPAAPPGVRDAQRAFVAALKSVGVHPNFVHTLIWDPTLIVIDALRHVGPDASAAQVNAYIQSLTAWRGINGTPTTFVPSRNGVSG